ncbi:MAG: DUF3429 domain-containing protein [Ahrensia sp.]|nr:DUF3429 domain-containing protein [Ahrensia sp.]
MSARQTAWALALAGFIPFGGLLAAALFLSDDGVRGQATFALAAYGAVVLSFLGGIRWGLGLSRDDETTAQQLALSVVPSLAGWCSLLLAQGVGFALLAVAFVAQGVRDNRSGMAGQFPAWFMPLRTTLTLMVTAVMVAAAFLLG